MGRLPGGVDRALDGLVFLTCESRTLPGNALVSPVASGPASGADSTPTVWQFPTTTGRPWPSGPWLPGTRRFLRRMSRVAGTTCRPGGHTVPVNWRDVACRVLENARREVQLEKVRTAVDPKHQLGPDPHGARALRRWPAAPAGRRSGGPAVAADAPLLVRTDIRRIGSSSVLTRPCNGRIV
jgi:hypothetical protein